MMQAVLPSHPFISDARQQAAVCAIADAVLFAVCLRGLTYPFSKATDWRLPLRPVFAPDSPDVGLAFPRGASAILNPTGEARKQPALPQLETCDTSVKYTSRPRNQLRLRVDANCRRHLNKVRTSFMTGKLWRGVEVVLTYRPTSAIAGAALFAAGLLSLAWLFRKTKERAAA